MNNFSAKKSDKLIGIQEDYQKRLEEKMKKVHDSTDLIKKIEEKRNTEYEVKKMERYEIQYENLSRFKSELESKRSKDKRRFEDVRDNFTQIQRKFEKKNKELSNKLKKKTLHIIADENIENYFTKRQSSIERFSQNSSNIKKDNAERKLRFLELQQDRNIRSHDKVKTLDMSKDNVR